MHARQPSRALNRSMRGSALITVTLIGLFIMLVAAALVNNYATGEARAIADSLAKTRIYWAAMGHVNFALSRSQREGMCEGTCSNDDDDGSEDPTGIGNRADNLRTYLIDLNTGGDDVRIWNFEDNYSFKLKGSVADRLDTNDGRLTITISLDPVAGTPFDVLNGIEQRMRGNLVVEVCLSAPCGPGNIETNGDTQIEAHRRESDTP